jgi:hypothetical protein
VILEAAREFKLSKDAKNPNHWWDDECKRAIQEKNEARGKCLIRKTITNLDIYQQKRTKANRICRRKKKEWIKGKIKEINETNKKTDTRKFYKDVRKLSNLPIATTLVCKDKDGNISPEKQQILERWQKCFKELLNSETEKKNSTKTYEAPINNLEREEPTYEE